MTTGAEFYAILQNRYDQAYSAYLDETNANRLIKQSLINLVDKLYSNNDTQKEDDELFSMLVKNETINVTGGVLPVDNLTFPYMHTLRMAFVYKETLANFSHTDAATDSYYSTTTNVRVGDVIEISGATDPNHNTTYTITKVRGLRFWMPFEYVDGTAKLKRVIEAKKLRSQDKKSTFSVGTQDFPRYQQTFDDNYLKPNAFVLTPAPTQVEIDYMIIPDQDIDVTDNISDLENYYSLKFLYRLIDECVFNFATQTRDIAGRQLSTQDIINNP